LPNHIAEHLAVGHQDSTNCGCGAHLKNCSVVPLHNLRKPRWNAAN
jgi:hypothetical protein